MNRELLVYLVARKWLEEVKRWEMGDEVALRCVADWEVVTEWRRGERRRARRNASWWTTNGGTLF